MGTVNQFSAKKLLDPANEQFSGQGRVNAEIFTAMEILGRKLERSESERDRLARRLAQIESAATLDEKTGKLYLPVLVDPLQSRQEAASRISPKWTTRLSLASSAIAMIAIGIVLFRAPAPALTPDQLAVLDSLKGTQFALQVPESKAWKHLQAENSKSADTAENAAPEQQTAETASQPADAPAVAAAASEAPASSEEAPAAAVEEKPAEKHAAKEAQREQPPVVLSKDERTVSPPVQTAKAEAESESDLETNLQPDTDLPAKLAQLEKRAYDGVPEAQHDLAALYASGKLVPQSYKRAIYWFGKAADGGVANAHYNLGVIYQQGLGVKPDVQKAIDWYEKAAELGHPEAMYNLGIIFIKGVGTKPDIAKGVSYFKRAADAGVTQAAYNLGVLYESNFIGAIDTAKALEWYQVAAKQGHAEAIAAVSRLKSTASSEAPEDIEPAAGTGNE